MSEIYIPLIAALVGALLGSLTSIITIVVQSRHQNKIATKQKAIDAAIENYKFAMEMLKKKGGEIPPLGIYIYYHMELLKLIENNQMSSDALISLGNKQRKLTLALKEQQEKLNDI